MREVIDEILDFPRWFWTTMAAAFVVGNVTGVLILCSVIDLMAGR